MFKRITMILGGLLLLSACEDNDTKKCLSLSQDKGKSLLAEDFCEKAAQNGNAESQRLFAEILLQRGEKEQAVSFLQKSANQKNGEAMYRLAELYVDDEKKAIFYYEQSCQNGILKGCEQLSLLNSNKELENARKAIEQEKAEIAAKLEAERAELTKREKEAQEKLEAERRKLIEQQELQNRHNQSQATNTTIHHLFISQNEILDTFDSVLSSLKKEQPFQQWVENCYARSNKKLGCFHYDLWVNTLLEANAKANNKSIDPYFADSRIRNRALRNITELQNITTAQFNQIVSDSRKKLLEKEGIFWQKFEQLEKSHSTQSNRSNHTINTASLTFNEGLAKYEQNGLWGFVDQQGRIVISPQFRAVGGFYNGRAVVQVSNKNWGYIDKQGNWVINPQFCMAGRFSEGLAGVYVGGYRSGDECYGGKWGYITPSGKFAINAVLDRAWAFTKEKGKPAKAKVIYNGYTGYINGRGEWVN